jgi:Putative general bacterial porin
MQVKLLLSALGLAAAAASADTYQVELGASATRLDQNGIDSTGDRYGLDGKLYFKPVSTVDVPFAEAAYLGLNSNVFSGFARAYGESSSTNLKAYHADVKAYSGGLEVYIPENFLYTKVEGKHYRYPQRSDTEVEATVGLTPVDGLRLTTSWNSDHSYRANISAKYVMALVYDQYLNLETTLINHAEKRLGGDFYFDNSFSVGASYSKFDDDSDAYELRTRKFFAPNWSGALTYIHANPNVNPENQPESEITLGMNIRF